MVESPEQAARVPAQLRLVVDGTGLAGMVNLCGLQRWCLPVRVTQSLSSGAGADRDVAGS